MGQPVPGAPGIATAAMTGQQIYDNFQQGTGSEGLHGASRQFQQLAGKYADLQRDIEGLMKSMAPHWKGKAGSLARHGAGPIAVEFAAAKPHLDTSQDLIGKQGGLFDVTKRNVKPVPPAPDPPSGWDAVKNAAYHAVTGDKTEQAQSYETQLGQHNDAAKHNVDQMNMYRADSHYNSVNLPTSYGHMIGSEGQIHIAQAGGGGGGSVGPGGHGPTPGGYHGYSPGGGAGGSGGPTDSGGTGGGPGNPVQPPPQPGGHAGTTTTGASSAAPGGLSAPGYGAGQPGYGHGFGSTGSHGGQPGNAGAAGGYGSAYSAAGGYGAGGSYRGSGSAGSGESAEGGSANGTAPRNGSQSGAGKNRTGASATPAEETPTRAPGRAGRMGALPPGGGKKGGDDQEHERPSWLVEPEPDKFWFGDQPPVAPPVIE